jgi:hypothetical protein
MEEKKLREEAIRRYENGESLCDFQDKTKGQQAVNPLTFNQFGEGGRTRTAGHLLKRQMLYRLSYTPM